MSKLKSGFAKILVLPEGGEILIRKDKNEEYEIIIHAETESVYMSARIGYATEELRDDVFKNFNPEDAIGLFSLALK